MIRQPEFFQTMGIAESKIFSDALNIELADVVAQAVKRYI